MTETIACFTGHRPKDLGGYNEADPVNIQVKKFLQNIVEKSYSLGYRTFISGMAQGVDIWGAEAVLCLQERHPEVRLVAAVPFPGQGCTWPYAGQQRWKQVLLAANEIHVVSTGADHFTVAEMDAGLLDKSLDTWEVNKWLQKRNEWMVDRSRALIALWTGKTGGTGNCVAYARKKRNINILVCNPFTGMMHVEKADDSVK